MTTAEQSFLAQLANVRFTDMQVQSAEYDGVVIDPWNVFFFETDGGKTLRFFFDAGVFFWSEKSPALPENAGRMTYRLARPQALQPYCQKKVLASNIGPSPNHGRLLGIWFEDASALFVQNVDDRTIVVTG